ncbi:hypothetical protein TRV_03447 [Trichophyton verrucosum HKI 0517]|uniref:Uncharacterized protein n=1 Tax=Trichophyton verrucosum (strain HKI 0517) TaxID=663202 RepID=D4D8L0_TRIVH|nr:uncharacterized protein TRV_03447 [Trichophyton verrucosum HKI 0517]EFE41765.1 hypothetical protein TRV_03447 [Trichophyton verrucosum HKI 0517]
MLVTGKRKAKENNKAQREAENSIRRRKEGFGHGMAMAMAHGTWDISILSSTAGLGWAGEADSSLLHDRYFCFFTSSCSLLRPD